MENTKKNKGGLRIGFELLSYIPLFLAVAIGVYFWPTIFRAYKIYQNRNIDPTKVPGWDAGQIVVTPEATPSPASRSSEVSQEPLDK
jgi:hypothetical protein